MYWYDAGNLQSLKAMHEKNRAEVNYLELFDCRPNTSITKVASIADEYGTPNGFRNLLMRLGDMNEVERKDKIRQYNDLLLETAKIDRKKSKDIIKFMLGGAAFLPLSYSLSVVLSLIGILNDRINNSGFVQKDKEIELISEIVRSSGFKCEEQLSEDIYLLDKITRVAILK